MSVSSSLWRRGRAPPRSAKLPIGHHQQSIVGGEVRSIRASGSVEVPTMSLDNAKPADVDKSKWKIPPPSHPCYDIREVIRQSLAEDLGDIGDVTCNATIPAEVCAEAKFLAKANGVLAGLAVAEMVFTEVDPELEVCWTLNDGDSVTKGTVFGVVTGRAKSILMGERLALNFMQRMSGIATATKEMAEAAQPARILETRKTAPGLRLLDKWAVLIGGGENHRMGLFDMVLIKDNHIAAAGGIPQAVAATRDYLIEHNLDMEVEVETRTLEEVEQVLQCRGASRGRVTRIMLDNMVVKLPDGRVDTSMLKKAVQKIAGSGLETEASGNVTLETVKDIGATGVTFISSGALSHSVKALDISLNIDTDLALAVGKRTLRV